MTAALLLGGAEDRDKLAPGELLSHLNRVLRALRPGGIGQGGVQVFDHQTGDTVEIEVRFPHGIHIMSIGDRRTVVEIHMPREGKVRLHTGDGEIRLRDLNDWATGVLRPDRLKCLAFPLDREIVEDHHEGALRRQRLHRNRLRRRLTGALLRRRRR